ncbi:gephyrin-like molybdotransferase Glp [Streptomyces sp. TRM 70351]|uniref:molybdotransferase-like divisome protein Glp n=1 Tax=Streptomyces sp. TRM 70351 TaxID=3116552 RepID=UPI002E7B0B82|nr:gephyrin-like molybdotransferase Glp [Streptomyces sp. TRM 70351]MEE1929491.1 gephyrin-like molybdotransferase Glp [Streptomyces sp. TRM 70351]
MSGLWSVDDHLADVLDAVRPLEPIELQLLEAQGCVLVEDVTVPAALPPFDNSSMDGYAVRTADVEGAGAEYPAVLAVVGDVAAGSGELPTVAPGQAARIMTGAPLPPGAEAVVPVEWTDGGTGGGPAEAMAAHAADPSGSGGEVRVHRPVRAGQYVRTRGSDVAAGTVALRAGTVLGPPQLGLLAAIGRGTVPVRPRPRVVVLSTGSELVAPGEELRRGAIHDSNSYVLTAAARDAGGLPYRVGAVADDADALRAAIEDQLVRADVIVTSGGVSVGAYDVVKEALSSIGTAPGDDLVAWGRGVEFRRLAMQPGKPQGFGLIGADRVPLLALPGNPVSAYVSFELFVRPVIRTLMGAPDVHRPRVRARLATAAPLTSPEGKRQFLRAAYTPPDGTDASDETGAGAGAAGVPVGTGTVRPVGGAGSHLIAALAQADALAVIPETVTEAADGDELEVVLLG